MRIPSLLRFRSRRLCVGIAALGVCLAALGCTQNNSAPANIVGYNHTDTHLARYSVNGYGSSSIGAHEGGGAFTCCVGVPLEWQPGMTATISWRWHESEDVHTAEVPVPRYERAGDFAVHFLRSGEVKVFVTNYALAHPEYPLQGEQATMRPGVPLRRPWGSPKD